MPYKYSLKSPFFFRQLYIILVKPERNVRQSMMSTKRSAIKTGTTASVMVGALPIAHPIGITLTATTLALFFKFVFIQIQKFAYVD